MLKVEQLSLPEFRRQFLSHSFSHCKCRDFRVAGIPNSSGMGLRETKDSDRAALRADMKLGDPRPRRFPRFRLELPSRGTDDPSVMIRL